VQRLKERLAALDPPLKHLIESRGESVVITLIDPTRLLKVSRVLSNGNLSNEELVYTVMRDAVNELRDRSDLSHLNPDELRVEPDRDQPGLH
jgi:hypothetical protein